MDKEKILRKIVQKAVDGGFDMKPYLPAFPNKKIVGRFLQVIYKEFIYTSEFAEAMGFKLRDLGTWCNNGGDPLKFIKKLL